MMGSTSRSVSYTHLDVYKRQRYARSGGIKNAVQTANTQAATNTISFFIHRKTVFMSPQNPLPFFYLAYMHRKRKTGAALLKQKPFPSHFPFSYNYLQVKNHLFKKESLYPFVSILFSFS